MRVSGRCSGGPAPLGQVVSEEETKGLGRYIEAMPAGRFDVILVDGRARSACLARARDLLALDGVVFLIDAERPCYDDAKRLFIDREHIGSCADYPGPHLWKGSTRPVDPQPDASALPVVVSFYTIGTPYEREVQALVNSCRKLGLRHEVLGVESRGSWERNCAYKARHVQAALDRLAAPIVWVDADAVIRRPPKLLAGCRADFAIHKHHRWELLAGTVFINHTPLARLLLKEWVARCDANPVGDQINLDLAWEAVVRRHPLQTMWLPQSYARIFNAEPDPVSGSEPVIEQFQASRRFKRAVSQGESPQRPSPDEQIIRARMACRPRPEVSPTLPGC